jgi:hypothetical protein
LGVLISRADELKKGGFGGPFFTSSFYFEQDALALADSKALRVLTVCKA